MTQEIYELLKEADKNKYASEEDKDMCLEIQAIAKEGTKEFIKTLWLTIIDNYINYIRKSARTLRMYGYMPKFLCNFYAPIELINEIYKRTNDFSKIKEAIIYNVYNTSNKIYVVKYQDNTMFVFKKEVLKLNQDLLNVQVLNNSLEITIDIKYIDKLMKDEEGFTKKLIKE